MKLVYGISRWTNASRAAARHIAAPDGLPLCGDTRRAYWETEEGEPSCNKCKRLIEDYDKKFLAPRRDN